MPDTEDQNKNAADQWAETMGTLASSWQEAMSNWSATWSENVQTAFDTAADASKAFNKFIFRIVRAAILRTASSR